MAKIRILWNLKPCNSLGSTTFWSNFLASSSEYRNIKDADSILLCKVDNIYQTIQRQAQRCNFGNAVGTSNFTCFSSYFLFCTFVNLEAYEAKEVNKTFSGRQLRQGMKVLGCFFKVALLLSFEILWNLLLIMMKLNRVFATNMFLDTFTNRGCNVAWASCVSSNDQFDCFSVKGLRTKKREDPVNISCS